MTRTDIVDQALLLSSCNVGDGTEVPCSEANLSPASRAIGRIEGASHTA